MSQLPAKEVYKFINGFERTNEFVEFARSELGLQNYEINGILDDYKESREQRYQIISLWKRKNGRQGTIRRLYELKQQTLVDEQEAPPDMLSSPSYGRGESSPAGTQRTIAEVRIQVPLQNAIEDKNRFDTPPHSQVPMRDMANTSGTSTHSWHTPEPINGKSRCEPELKALTLQDEENRNDLIEVCEPNRESEHPAGESLSTVEEESRDESSSSPPEETLTHRNEIYTSVVKATHGEPSRQESAGKINDTNVLENSSGPERKIEIQKPVDYFSICSSALPDVVVDYDSDGNLPAPVENDGCYPVSDKPVKGYVMIFNNTFKGVKGHTKRKGSKVDVKNLKNLWDQIGGCQVFDKSDLSAGRIMDEIHKFVTSKERKDCGFVAFFVMSHGDCDYYLDNKKRRKGEGYFLGNDGKKVMISDVLKMLENGYQGTTLQGIPKLIFFQMCRGDRLRQELVDLPPVATDGPSQYQESLATDNAKAATGDVLQGYATLLGDMSMRDENKGSWYINAIVNIFSKYAKDEHVLDLMTRVHWAVSEMIGKFEEKPCMQISEVVSSLCHNLRLCPSPPY